LSGFALAAIAEAVYAVRTEIKSFFIEFMHLGVRQIATLCLVLSGEWAFCLL
jgi:hypothetical protein